MNVPLSSRDSLVGLSFSALFRETFFRFFSKAAFVGFTSRRTPESSTSSLVGLSLSEFFRATFFRFFSSSALLGVWDRGGEKLDISETWARSPRTHDEEVCSELAPWFRKRQDENAEAKFPHKTHRSDAFKRGHAHESKQKRDGRLTA